MSYQISFDTHDELTRNLKERLTTLLTVSNKNRSLEVADIEIPPFERKDNLKAQKAAKIQGTSYSVPVKATLVLKEDGKVINRGKVKILDLPQVTTRGTYVVGGNEYSFPLQKRLIPGVYTREHDDGTVSAWLNSSRGANMSVVLREGGDFIINIGATVINLTAVLTGLGISAQRMRQAWGEEVFNNNAKSRGATDPLKALEKLYSKLHYPSDPPVATKDVPGYRAWILNYFENKSAFDPENVEITLGKGFSENSTELLMAVTQRILEVSRGDKKEDNKESLIHNNIFDLSDFVIERLNQRQYLSRITRTITRNMMRFDKVSEIIQKDIFQTPVESTFTQTSLGRIPKQTNPMDQMSSFSEITVMGEGGIGDVHAITNDVRAVDPSHLGFIDLAHTPEGINIGTSLHLAHGVGKKGKDLVNKVIDVSKNQNVEVNPRQFFKSYIAFPESYQNGKVVTDKDGMVKVIHKGEILKVRKSQVQYAMRVSTDMFGVNTMGVPFLSHNNGTRVMTAAKMQSQAKPLKYREKPLILSALNEFTDATVEDAVGKGSLPRSPVDGVVSKVSKETIAIKDKDGKEHSVDIPVDFWMNENNYTTVDAKVKVGDKIKAGDILGDSNYTKDGTLALGMNLRTAYVAYKGYNHEDATVISETAAEKLTSLHAYQKLCPVSDNEVLEKAQYLSYFPAIFDRTQIDRLDDDGVIKPGKKVRRGDPLVVKMRKIEEDTLSKKLQNISRLLTQDYRDTSFIWDKDAEGEIAEVHRRRKDIMIVVKTEEKAKVGDKLVARYGNKATITTVLPDSEMPKDGDGNAMEILMNPDGVGGRMNLGQILETTASKICEKTGKPYIAKPFGGDYTNQIGKELKKHGLKDHGTLHDADGDIEGVLFGKQYVLKLEHQVEKKLSGRGAGPEYAYTMDGAPARGDGESGRSIGLGEMYALLAHGADANLKEMYTFKGDKQVEIWRAIEQGTYVPPPDMPFSSEKFASMLRGMGIDLQEKSGKVSMVPFLDRDVKKYSNGSIKDATAIRGKDLKEEKGGLFDFRTTGGVIGDKWSHIDLAEPMPHPSFEKSILDVTGITKNDLYDIMAGKKGVVKGKVVSGETKGAAVGGVAVKQLLKAIDPDSRLKEISKIGPTKKGSELNKMHREARVLRNFKDNGIKLEEMVIEKVPVIPPKFRPIVELPNGDLSVADVNEHYRALILMSQQLEKFKDRPGLKDEANKVRGQVYTGLQGTMGFDKGLVDKPDVKGLAHTIAGRNPKSGYYQSKVLRKRQDLSGTGVVGPDPKLGMDELGVPENMAWDIFKPFVIKELRSSGFTSIKAREEMENKTKIARAALQKVMGERLVMMNRAPTLHKFSLMAFKPKLVPGYQVKVPVEILGGYNMDFDGDSVGIHVPASREALEEAHSMLPSNNLYSTGNARTKMVPSIGKEYMIGVYKLSRAGKAKNKTFKTTQEAIKAAESKQIDWNDVVAITGIGRTTAGRALLNSFVPSDLRDYNVVFDDKKIQVMFDSIYKKHGKDAFIKAIEGWKHAGRKHVYTSGSSFLLSDLKSITPEVNKIYDKADKDVAKIRSNARLSKKEKDEKAIAIYSDVDSKVIKMSLSLPNNNTGKSNNITDMVDSGMSKPGPAQLKQLVGSVGLMLDHRNEVIPEPVRGNYADGLTSADFYAHMFSQRKGMIDRSRAVSGPGMLSKELTNTASTYKISESDCNTKQGRSEVIDRHLLDKLLAEDLPGVPRDTTIDAEVLEKIKKLNRPKVKVRSILTCESGNGGLCAKCFGIDEYGNFPAIGKNVGINEIQAITERSVQLPMKNFHSGGVASAGPGSANAFDRALQLFRMPENVKGKATLAELSGVVTAIRPSGYGGHVVNIGAKEHKVAKDRKLTVKVGDTVKKGDTITDGVVKPQELLKLKGIESVQERMRDDLHEAFAGAGVKIQKKTYELPVKMYTEQVRITDPGDCGDYVPGDHSTLSKVKGWNSKNSMRRQIKYMSILPGSLYAPMKTDDWAQRMALGRIQATLQEGAGMGLHSDRKGGSPFADLALGPGTRLKRPGEK